jgi:hypothetical protein
VESAFRMSSGVMFMAFNSTPVYQSKISRYLLI